MAYTNAIIFIHGLGDSGRGWSFLESMMPAFPNRKVHYTFPNAPNQAVSCNGNSVMPSWFDIQAIPVDLNEPDDPTGIEESIIQIHNLIDSVCSENNLKPENVILGGFSQGGAMSLLAGSTYHSPLGGVVCLSGWLLRKQSNVASWGTSKSTVPLFIGHGEADQVVLTSLGKETYDRIKVERKEAGAAVDFKTYIGEGHGACDDELKDLAKFFNEALK